MACRKGMQKRHAEKACRKGMQKRHAEKACRKGMQKRHKAEHADCVSKLVNSEKQKMSGYCRMDLLQKRFPAKWAYCRMDFLVRALSKLKMIREIAPNKIIVKVCEPCEMVAKMTPEV